MTVQKSVRIKNSVQDRIIKAIHEHKKEFYDTPDYLILGGEDYLKLMASVQEMTKYQSTGMVRPENFYGLPIMISGTRGIRMGFKDNYKWAIRFSKFYPTKKRKAKNSPAVTTNKDRG